MFCPNCGKEIKDGATFCEECGAKIIEPPKAAPEPEPQPVPPVQPTPQPIIVQQPPLTKDTLPAKFRPLGAWAYFGYSILFSIPIVGFIFLIVFSFSGKNINRRSFARSYWCWAILLVIVIAVVLAIAAATTGVSALFDKLGIN